MTNEIQSASALSQTDSSLLSRLLFFCRLRTRSRTEKRRAAQMAASSSLYGDETASSTAAFCHHYSVCSHASGMS
jgi:hypothetical protein